MAGLELGDRLGNSARCAGVNVDSRGHQGAKGLGAAVACDQTLGAELRYGFSGLALGAPFVKLIGMARSPIAACMVGKTIGRTIDEGQLPVYVERFGRTRDEIFVTAGDLRKELGNDAFEKLPTGAIGLYTYYERLAQGLRQLMCGSRKFALEYMTRDDLATLTPEAAEIRRLWACCRASALLCPSRGRRRRAP